MLMMLMRCSLNPSNRWVEAVTNGQEIGETQEWKEFQLMLMMLAIRAAMSSSSTMSNGRRRSERDSERKSS